MKKIEFSRALLPFLPQNSRITYSFLICLTLLIQVVALSLLFFEIPLHIIAIVLLAVPIIFFMVSSVEHFFALIVIYSTCFHLQVYSGIFKGFFPFGVAWEHLYALYGVFLIYWFFSLILKRRTIKVDLLGKAILIYVGISFASFILGLINNNYISKWYLARSEVFPQLMYLSYFVVMTTNLKNIKRRKIFDLTLIASVFIGLQLIYAFSRNSLASFTRINPVTVHISLLVLPYVLGVLFFAKQQKRKILVIIASVPISFAALISLQRSLWLAIFAIIVLSLFIYFYKRGFSLGRIFTLLFVIIVGFLLVLFIAVLGLAKITSGEAPLVLLKRLVSLVSIAYLRVDASAYVRLTEIKQALSKLEGIQWIIGRGIGDTFYSFLRTKVKPYLDNSYAWVLWKMGIIGLISFLSIFVIFFQRSLFLLRKCHDREDLIHIMTLSLNILGLLIVSLGNAALIQFRYIIIWAASMAIMEIIYRKYKHENTVDMFGKTSRRKNTPPTAA